MSSDAATDCRGSEAGGGTKTPSARASQSGVAEQCCHWALHPHRCVAKYGRAWTPRSPNSDRVGRFQMRIQPLIRRLGTLSEAVLRGVQSIGFDAEKSLNPGNHREYIVRILLILKVVTFGSIDRKSTDRQLSCQARFDDAYTTFVNPCIYCRIIIAATPCYGCGLVKRTGRRKRCRH